jgi:hypothetical protein
MLSIRVATLTAFAILALIPALVRNQIASITKPVPSDGHPSPFRWFGTDLEKFGVCTTREHLSRVRTWLVDPLHSSSKPDE